jgi:magnesium transporter
VATLISTSVIAIFQDTLANNIQLATILPIAGAIGGNSACQVLTITVRALSNQEINSNNINRVIRKEVIAGLGSGLIIGACMACWYWFTGYGIRAPLILMIALMVNVMWAGFIGSAVPIALDRYFNKDPALASVGLSILTDAMGFFVLLSLAKFFMIG